MSYEVTATKFRPQTFDELIGQEFVVATLKNSIQNQRIANAYLLSGPRGCGKTSTARIIAKALNCTTGPTATPCNTCYNCTSITSGSNTDVLEIDGASNTSINDIRVIQEEILYPPVNLRYKVYIIDEVHMLSKNAFNALLKTIEEPPAHVIFIFATTEVNKVLPTIRSRCQQFNLRLIPVDSISLSLSKVLDLQKIKYEQEALYWIANEGKGSMRDSYTLLDQVISFCENDITMKKIQDKLGLVGEERLSLLVAGILNKDREIILKEYFTLLESGISPEQIITELIKFFRNILILKTKIQINKFININKKFYSDSLIEQFSFDDIENILEILFLTFEKSKYSVDIQTEIEVCLIKLIKYKDFIRPKQILQELNTLKNQLSANMDTPPTNQQTNNLEKKNQQINKNIKIETDKSEIIRLIKSKIPPTNFQLIAALNNISSIEETGIGMTLHFSQEIHYDTAIKYKEVLIKEAFGIIGKEYKIDLIYSPELKQHKSKTIGEVNTERIKQIFNGKELY